MIKFNEQEQIDSVRGALALRKQIEAVVDSFCQDGYRNICWLVVCRSSVICVRSLLWISM